MIRVVDNAKSLKFYNQFYVKKVKLLFTVNQILVLR